MKKMTYSEFRKMMFDFNDKNQNDGKSISGVIVFTQDSFNKPYSEQERSYTVTNNNYGFQSGKISNSIYGDCLDGCDYGVRLDWYMQNGWKVEYCYFI